MNLKILLPAEILIDNEVTKIVAEAENGYFCLLPHHVDFVASLIPGIFSYEAFGNALQEGFQRRTALSHGLQDRAEDPLRPLHFHPRSGDPLQRVPRTEGTYRDIILYLQNLTRSKSTSSIRFFPRSAMRSLSTPTETPA